MQKWFPLVILPFIACTKKPVVQPVGVERVFLFSDCDNIAEFCDEDLEDLPEAESKDPSQFTDEEE